MLPPIDGYTKINLVSDRPIATAAITKLFADWPRANIYHRTSRELHLIGSLTRYDVVLVDASGLKVPLVRVVAQASVERILVLADSYGSSVVADAVTLGVFAFVFWDQSLDALREGIFEVREGRVRVDPRVVREILAKGNLPRSQPTDDVLEKFYSLTSRERDVASLLAAGLDAARIASLLGLAVPTVRVHLSKLFRKFEVTDSVQLVAYLYRNDLVRKLPLTGLPEDSSSRSA